MNVRVTGMTCSHCAVTVRRALASVAGVRDAAVDLSSRSATLTTDAPVDRAALAAAVADAGYALAEGA